MRLQHSWRYKAIAGLRETAVFVEVQGVRLVYVRLQYSWRYKATAVLCEIAVFVEVHGYSWSM